MQGMAGEMPLLPVEVPLSNYAVVFFRGSAGCSGRGGYKAALAVSGIREDDMYHLLHDWRVALSCLAAAHRSMEPDLAAAVRSLSSTFAGLFGDIGYV